MCAFLRNTVFIVFLIWIFKRDEYRGIWRDGENVGGMRNGKELSFERSGFKDAGSGWD